MNKKLKRISPSFRRFYPVLILFTCIIMGIGYATLNSVSLSITGQGLALLQKGVFITEVNYSTSKGADILKSEINATAGTVLNSTVALSSSDSTSYITYTVTVLNNNNYKVYYNGSNFDNNFYDNSNIVYQLSGNLVEGMMLEPGEYFTFGITFKYKSGVTPSQNNCTLNSYINFNFPSVAILKSSDYYDTSAFKAEAYKQKIKNITFQNKINVPSNAVESWDIGVAQTGDVMAYVVNSSTSGYYDLYIQSNSQLYANESMSYWFCEMMYIDSINGLNLLDTSNMVDMTSLFYKTGYYSTVLTLDLSSFNTSNVISMRNSFHSTGFSSTVFTLDVSSFDTSKVQNMSETFNSTGYNSQSLYLDLSGWDTSNVVNMSYMFHQTAYKNSSFTLDVSNFKTGNVTDMNGMFFATGSASKNIKFDVSKWDTSKVTNMRYMFYSVGVNNPNFTLDVSGFDTSKVTNFSGMFYQTAYSISSFKLDVSNFDTSSATDMSYMFYSTGRNNTSFQLDVSNFDTSNVTNFAYMFYGLGELNPAFVLDVSGFDTSKATDMSGMFYYAGHQSKVLHLDVSNFDTSNVTNMNSMFKWAGHENPTFYLDVSGFDTSNVTDMAEMFRANGIRNPNFTLNVSNFDTSKVTNMYYMFYFLGNATNGFVLDFSNWDTSNVTNMERMLNSAGVKTIYVSDKWDVSNVTNDLEMFSNVTKLVGGAGTTYSSSNVGKTYARIDGGASSPGYFTQSISGYSIINYIESNGTQYIDTGYKPTSENLKVELTFVPTENTNSDQSLFGNEINNSTLSSNGRQWAFVLYGGNDRWTHWVGYSANFYAISTELNTKYTYTGHANNGSFSLTFGGISATGSYSGSLLKTLNMFIFANHIDGSPRQFSSMKLYSFKMYDNDVLVRDYVPCINSSGKAGLYDFVTKKFYGNSGTGEFIAK